MSGKTRGQRRAEFGERCINLYPPDTALGWRVIRQVTPAEATKKVASGQWREVFDEHGNFWGYQVLANFKTDSDLPSGASSTSITARECELNAGLGGRSRTMGMIEADRISRRHPKMGKALPPEDAVERAIAKVKEFGKSRILANIVGAPNSIPANWDAFQELAAVANDCDLIDVDDELERVRL